MQNTTYAPSYINWSWIDPEDLDFSKVMIYIDGVFQANVSGGIQFYNATGLAANTSYTIGTNTVGTSGNVNHSWANHTARTAPMANITPPLITNFTVVPESQMLNGTVNISYSLSDKANVSINVTYPDGNVTELLQTNVSTMPYSNTIRFNITQPGEHIAKIMATDKAGNISSKSAKFFGINVTANTTTAPSSQSSSQSSGQSSGQSSSSGGGGGGGGTSGEDYKNIEKIEKYEKNIYRDVRTAYQFTQNGLVEFVNITGNTNADSVNVVTEVLRNTSSFAKTPAPYSVYRYVNIWVGTSGFAVPRNIKEAAITFRVNTTWLEKDNIREVVLYRYSDGGWVALPTASLQETGGENGYVRYHATTDHFSPFAITGVKAGEAFTQPTIQPTQQSSEQQPSEQLPVRQRSATRVTARTNSTAHDSSDDWGIPITVALVGIVAAAFFFIRKQMM